MQLKNLITLIESAQDSQPHFPPTLIYNEGWMLRLVIDWISSQRSLSHPLAFAEDAFWFSETLLPSAFSARLRGDKRAEARTHADGAVGHFSVGEKGKADLALLPTAMQFIVIEAKINSKLATGVKNNRDFDQAARNIACMAEVLKRANRPPEKMTSLGFFVLAPQSQIERGVFRQELTKSSIKAKVEHRVQEYGGELDAWYLEWFQPTLEKIRIEALSWDSGIALISSRDPGYGATLQTFWDNCLKFNK